MRLAFMGTARFAVPALETLVSAGHEILGVFTQPDRPSGRGRKPKPGPVKQVAQSLGLDVCQPDTLRSDAFEAQLKTLAPELIVVVAYGRILPRWLVELPAHGVLNLHASLLPKYRGAAPINWAIANGESRTGVCAMRIDCGLDTGPVYRCLDTAIGPEETAPELSDRLAPLGAGLLAETVWSIGRGEIEARPQDEAQATLAPRLTKEDACIRWEEPAGSLHNKIRGFLPWPGVVVLFRGRRCQLLKAKTTHRTGVEGPPGEIVLDGGHLFVRCGDARWLEIVSLRLENRRAVGGADFANGVRLKAGERFAFAGDSGPDGTSSPIH